MEQESVVRLVQNRVHRAMMVQFRQKSARAEQYPERARAVTVRRGQDPEPVALTIVWVSR